MFRHRSYDPLETPNIKFRTIPWKNVAKIMWNSKNVDQIRLRRANVHLGDLMDPRSPSEGGTLSLIQAAYWVYAVLE